MRNLDVLLTDSSPAGHLSKRVPARTMRLYESSYGGVSVVLVGEAGNIEAGLRLNVGQIQALKLALDDYLAATASKL